SSQSGGNPNSMLKKAERREGKKKRGRRRRCPASAASPTGEDVAAGRKDAEPESSKQARAASYRRRPRRADATATAGSCIVDVARRLEYRGDELNQAGAAKTNREPIHKQLHGQAITLPP
ncbi:unnamed protein product, partial [Urochloa humidicola]